MKSKNKVLRILALVAVVAISLTLLFGKKLGAFQHDHSAQSSAAASSSGERKILYWYDAINPQHTYNKPGKAPDGMDLVAEVRRRSACCGPSGHGECVQTGRGRAQDSLLV